MLLLSEHAYSEGFYYARIMELGREPERPVITRRRKSELAVDNLVAHLGRVTSARGYLSKVVHGADGAEEVAAKRMLTMRVSEAWRLYDQENRDMRPEDRFAESGHRVWVTLFTDGRLHALTALDDAYELHVRQMWKRLSRLIGQFVRRRRLTKTRGRALQGALGSLRFFGEREAVRAR